MGSDGIDDITEWLVAQKWPVESDHSGYTRIFDPHGNYVTYYPCSPSNPRRRWLDVLTKVKKAGLPWPPLSKKELRARHRQEAQGE
jgi:hypothetical protein